MYDSHNGVDGFPLVNYYCFPFQPLIVPQLPQKLIAEHLNRNTDCALETEA
jgi:hypothetical protein